LGRAATGGEYYASVLPNHTVQYVKPPAVIVDCSAIITLPPLPAENQVQKQIFPIRIRIRIRILLFFGLLPTF
jgi:hypothetical protein